MQVSECSPSKHSEQLQEIVERDRELPLVLLRTPPDRDSMLRGGEVEE